MTLEDRLTKESKEPTWEQSVQIVRERVAEKLAFMIKLAKKASNK